MKSMRFSRLKHVNDIYKPEINIKETIVNMLKIQKYPNGNRIYEVILREIAQKRNKKALINN